MKLASIDDGTPEGLPVVVSDDLLRCAPATSIVANLVEALDGWDRHGDRLRGLAARLEAGRVDAWRFHEAQALAPVPVAQAPDGGTVGLAPARAGIVVPDGSGLVRARLDLAGLAGRDGRPRLLVLCLWLDTSRWTEEPIAPVVASPVALTPDALDDAVEPERPLVARVRRERQDDGEDQFRVVPAFAWGVRRPAKAPRCQIASLDGLDDLGRAGLRPGDRLRASLTDCRRRAVAGTIDVSMDPPAPAMPSLQPLRGAGPVPRHRDRDSGGAAGRA
jgi:hypothetical protein